MTTTTNNNNMIIELIHPTNELTKVSIHLYGGTILSYIVNGQEHLFMSKDAISDGTKPIRGGIPLVFPIFGPPSSPTDTMPQHGFARRNIWSIKTDIFINDDDYDDIYTGIILELIVNRDTISTDSVGCNNAWSKFDNNCQCSLFYNISLHTNKLLTTFFVNNTGHLPFDYQALFHTYYKCHDDTAMDPKHCYVKGLHNYLCIDDKVLPNKYYNMIQNDDDYNNYITISSKEVDRVYNPITTNSDFQYLDIIIGVGNHMTINVQSIATIMKSASISTASEDDTDNAKKLPISCVIWNPYKEKAANMIDFGNNEYHNMICVEPGMLYHSIDRSSTMISLQPHHTGMLQQTIHAVTTTIKYVD